MDKVGENLIIEAISNKMFKAYQMGDSKNKKSVEKKILKLLKRNPEFWGYKDFYGETIATTAFCCGFDEIVEVYLTDCKQFAKKENIRGVNLYNMIKARKKKEFKNNEIVKE